MSLAFSMFLMPDLGIWTSYMALGDAGLGLSQGPVILLPSSESIVVMLCEK